MTLYFYNNKNKFKIFNFKNNENLSKIKLAVDRNTDFELLKKIISQTKKRPILLEDILKILKNNPKFLKINSNFVPNEGLKKSLEEDKKFGF